MKPSVKQTVKLSVSKAVFLAVRNPARATVKTLVKGLAKTHVSLTVRASAKLQAVNFLVLPDAKTIAKIHVKFLVK